jgi:hypothetical protein
MNPAGGGNHQTYRFIIVESVEVVKIVKAVQVVEIVRW